MSGSPGGLAGSIVSFALMVLLAAWAINSAAHLVMAVLPVLIGVAVVLAIGAVALTYWRNRDQW